MGLLKMKRNRSISIMILIVLLSSVAVSTMADPNITSSDIFDNFDDNDLSEYDTSNSDGDGWDTDEYTDGRLIEEGDTDGIVRAKYTATSTPVSQGKQFGMEFISLGGSADSNYFAVEYGDFSGTYYAVELGYDFNELRVLKVNGSGRFELNKSTVPDYDGDENFSVDIQWYTNGTHVARLYNGNDNLVKRLVYKDSTTTDGTYRFIRDSRGTFEFFYADDFYIRQITPPKNQVSGTVSRANDSTLLDGVTVRAINQSNSSVAATATTNATGFYNFSLKNETYEIKTVAPSGYQTTQNSTERVTVSGSAVSGVDLELEVSAPPKIVDARPSGNEYFRNWTVGFSSTVKDPSPDQMNVSYYLENKTTGEYELFYRETNIQSGTSPFFQIPTWWGKQSWRVSVTDGQTRVNRTFSWRSAGYLIVIDGGTGDVVSDPRLNVDVYSEESAYGPVSLPDTDGIVPLQGVPDERLVASISAPGLSATTITIDDPVQTTRVVLQPLDGTSDNGDDDTTDGCTVEGPEQFQDNDGDGTGSCNETSDDSANKTYTRNFTLTDQTGRFPPSDSQLAIFHEVDWNDEPVIQVALGFGPNNKAGPVALEDGDVYVIEVRNPSTGAKCRISEIQFDPDQYPDPINLEIPSNSVCDRDGSGGGSDNQPPVARIKTDANNVSVGESLLLSGYDSSDPDGSIASYEWAVDGSQRNTGPTYNWTPQTPGLHNVSLTVTDDGGATDTTTISVLVAGNNSPPVADFDFNETAPIVGNATKADAAPSSDPDGSIASYEWVANGSFSSGQTRTIRYQTTGTKSIQLTVTDNDGASSQTSKRIYVAPNASARIDLPDVAFTVTPSNPDAGQSVEFDASATTAVSGDPIVSYQWDFNGDGTIDAKGQVVNETFTTNGTYPVGLKVITSEGLINSTAKQVVVGNGDFNVSENGRPNASFTIKPSRNVENAQTITVNASNSTDPENNLTAYEWDLDGDGNFDDASGQVVKFSKDASGLYQVALRVTDNVSQTDVAIKTVRVGSSLDGNLYRIGATLNESVPAVRLFIETSNGTTLTNVNATLRTRHNRTTFYQRDFGDVSGAVGEAIPLNSSLANKTIIVTVNATFEGERVEFRKILGGEPNALGIELSRFWSNVLIFITTLMTMGVLGGVRAELGAAAAALLNGFYLVTGFAPPYLAAGSVILVLLLAAMFRMAGGESP